MGQSSLTQRSSGHLLELAPSVSVLDGVQQRRHVLTETPQSIRAAALHRLQVPSVGVR